MTAAAGRLALSSWPGLTRPSTSLLQPSQDVDARHIRAFTPVFRRAKAGHDDAFKRGPPMATMNLLLLPGDGIGPEVMTEVKKLIAWMNSHGMGTFATEEGLCGGCAYDAHGVAVTDEVVAKAKAADAVIFGSGGGAEGGKGAYQPRRE